MVNMTSAFYAICSLLLVLGFVHEGKADACTDIGGTCLDWRNYKCTAGYVTGLCPGDSNIRCCQLCDQTCLSNEATWSQSDGACTAAGGKCQDKSNYCVGSYSTGKCGGPSTRQCCAQRGNGRAMTDRGYNLIKCFEGLCLHAYQDVGGVWTIGYGAIEYEDGTPVRPGDTITKERADSMFAYQIDSDYAPSVDEDVGILTPVDINQVQYEALVSFTYNVGTAAFESSTLLKKVKVNPNDPTIRDEFMRWVNVNGVPVQGLINRRQKEADYYFSVDNSVCTPVESCS